MDGQTQAFYSSNAESLARRYWTAEHGIADYFPEHLQKCHKVLDVGCGAGRDFCSLMLGGYDAYGADPCIEMIETARAHCLAKEVNPAGRLFCEGLPDLPSFDDGEFDAVVCSAVLMHVPNESLFDVVYGLRRVLRRDGRLLLSVPSHRPDVDPKTCRDQDGRYFADLPAAKLKLLFERVGFRLLFEQEDNDSMNRPGHSWSVLLFKLVGCDSGRPLDLVESILNRDKKDATYKLALFRALAEIAQTQYNVARYVSNQRVKIPIETIASKWLIYYWPLVASKSFIVQKQGESRSGGKPLAIRKPLEELARGFEQSGGLPAFLMALKSGKLNDASKRYFTTAMSKIRSTIWNMPVRYAGGGEDFSVLGYDKKDCTITMPAELWRELTLTGSWIQDATILRWAELTERLSDGTVPISCVVEKLLSICDTEREIADARRLYSKACVSECVWSGKHIISAFDVDHAIPFVLWRNNDLWNLFPTHPAVNNSKRDKLPTQRILQDRRDKLIACWELARDCCGARFDREASALCGDFKLNPGNWQAPLFARFAEAIEITAIQRSVPRWEPDGYSYQAKRIIQRPVPSSTMYGTGSYGSRKAMMIEENPISQHHATMSTRDFPEIRDEAYVRYLPVIGALAAGPSFHGFEISDLEQAQDCPWVSVPGSICRKNRFVVQVAGDSMEPELCKGVWAVFEYHRTPRRTNQIVIANITEFGVTSDLRSTEAIKRLVIAADYWVFVSTNPRYEPIRIPRAGCSYPILGTFVAALPQNTALYKQMGATRDLEPGRNKSLTRGREHDCGRT